MTTKNLPQEGEPITVELDLNDHEDMPDHIYDFLLERFRHTAGSMGFKYAHEATFEDWTISCKMRDYNG